MKAYTDIEQSKKLAKILPIESVDMYYAYYHNPISGASYYEEYPMLYKPICNPNESVPCWSLATLYGVLPLVDFTTPQLIGTPKTLYRCMYNDDLKSHAYDNPVDACYEMIIRLHELNLL